MGMTTADAAKYLNLSPDHVAKLCSKGIIQASRHGPLWNIDLASVDKYKGGMVSPPTGKSKISSNKIRQSRNNAVDKKLFAIFEELRTVKLICQLSACLYSSEPSDVLYSGLLLKNLLLDNPPLVSFLLNDYNTDLRFIVGKMIPQAVIDRAPASQFLLIQDSFDPRISSGNVDQNNYNLSEFLSVNVLYSGGVALNVGGLILYISNAISHSQKDRNTARQVLIQTVSQRLCPGGISPALRLLRAIGNVLFRSLDPYLDYATILNSTK